MTRTRRPVFDPNAIDDEIEDFFSASPSPPDTESSPSDPAHSQASPRQRPQSRTPTEAAAADPAQAEPPTRQSSSSSKRKSKASSDDAPEVDSRTGLSTSASPPEVSIAPDVYQALRRLTLNERRTDPTTARSYGTVVLDAIDQAADRLAGHWPATPPASRTNSLFSRSEPPRCRRRRRHATPPARVPLAGISADNAARLDDLAVAWRAGNRSILVEQALRFYLQVPASSDGVALPR